jgi:hypothetical protein
MITKTASAFMQDLEGLEYTPDEDSQYAYLEDKAHRRLLRPEVSRKRAYGTGALVGGVAGSIAGAPTKNPKAILGTAALGTAAGLGTGLVRRIVDNRERGEAAYAKRLANSRNRVALADLMRDLAANRRRREITDQAQKTGLYTGVYNNAMR